MGLEEFSELIATFRKKEVFYVDDARACFDWTHDITQIELCISSTDIKVVNWSY